MTTTPDTFATGPMWAGFIAFVIAMLALDLFVFGGKKAHRVAVKEALAWVIAWVCLALAFAGLLWWYLNDTQGAVVAQRKTLEFLAGYLIEQSLSIDNMFVFVMIFGYFAVPPELQRRVLLYGVLGAIVMRAGMILAGVWLVSQFAWILYIFGAFLVITGIKMLVFAESEPDVARDRCVKYFCGEMLGNLGEHLTRERCASVDHRRQYTNEIKCWVETFAHKFHCFEQLPQAFERIKFRLHW